MRSVHRKCILLVDDKPIWGGGQRVLLDYISCLAQDYDLVVVRPLDAVEDSILFTPVPVEKIPFPEYPPHLSSTAVQLKCIPKMLRTHWSLRQLVNHYRPDMILCNTLYSLIPVIPYLFFKRAIPVLFVGHNNDYPVNKATRFLLKHCAGIIGVGQGVLTGLPISTDQRQFLVPNSVNITTPPDYSLRDSLGWKDKWVCGYVGRLSEEKNILSLLQGFAGVREHLPEARLLLIGDGPIMQDAIDESRRLNMTEICHFTGYNSTPYGIMAALDALCLVSQCEGSPLALLEAMALGVPVLGTPVKGIVEILDNGRLGTLTDGCSQKQIFHGLIKLRQRTKTDQTCIAAKEMVESQHSLLCQKSALIHAIKSTLDTGLQL